MASSPNLNALGGGDEAGVQKTADTAAPAVVDYKSKLLALLALPPEATDEQIDAAILAAGAAQTGTGTDSQNQISDLQSQLSAANARIQEIEAAQKQREQAEIDELVAEAGELSPEAQAALKNALSTDRPGGMALLGAMKKPATSAKVVASAVSADEPNASAAETAAATRAPDQAVDTTAATPPKPKHDPKAAAQKTSESDRAKQIRKRASEITAAAKAKGKTISFNAAFSQAEKELKTAA